MVCMFIYLRIRALYKDIGKFKAKTYSFLKKGYRINQYIVIINTSLPFQSNQITYRFSKFVLRWCYMRF